MQITLKDFGRPQGIAKEQESIKRKFNSISRWLGVLVYSLKGFGA